MPTRAWSSASFLVVTFATLTVVGGGGCPGDPEPTLDPLDVPANCQPLLAGADCMLPFPSDYFRVDDDASPSGFAIKIEEPAKLITDDGYSADMGDFRAPDGFSTLTPVTFLLGEAVTLEGTVGIFGDPTSTTTSSSPTVILETETGRFVPHFVDIDPDAETPERQGVTLRLLESLRPSSHYVVAVKGMKNVDGKDAKTPEGFRRLRDGETSQDDELEAMKTHFDDAVFTPLKAAGVARDALQLAFDFTTGTEAHVLNDMLEIRAQALAALAAVPPVVVIDAVFEDDEGSFRTIRGTVSAPLFVESGVAGASLSTDSAGNIIQNGTIAVPFTAVVPYSVRDSYDAGRTLLFGHGFFGSRFELEGGKTRTMCHEFHAVCIAIDWWGMSDEDLAIVLPALASDVSTGMQFGERVPQAMVNWLAVTAALKNGSFGASEGFTRPLDDTLPGVVVDPADPNVTNAGASLVDAVTVNYLGISMGHILGGVLAALNPDLDKIMFHVGGAGFTQMMFRANPFKRFLFIIEFQVIDSLDRQKLAASMQIHFDRFDPARYAPYVLNEDLPSGPASGREKKSVLISYGKGDTQVPNSASILHARLLGIPHLSPTPRPTYFIDSVETGDAESAASWFDTPLDDSFYEVAEPPEIVNNVHDESRTEPEVIEQMRVFLDEGRVINPCVGLCTLDISVD